MWTRSDLKRSAKNILKQCYWMCVLVSFIFSLIGGSGGNVRINKRIPNPFRVPSFNQNFNQNFNQSFNQDFGQSFSQGFSHGFDQATEQTAPNISSNIETNKFIFSALAGTIIFIVLIALVLGFLLAAFLFCPLQVGCKRYFINCRYGQGRLENVGFVFTSNYLNVVKIMFLMMIKIMLWSLLFIIPGIIKSYEYMMVPYLLAEDPSMDSETAFATSRAMMNGQKMNAFILQLSFIGWHILGVFTFGLLSIFYVNPYLNLTNAELYHAISSGRQVYQNEYFNDPNPYSSQPF